MANAYDKNMFDSAFTKLIQSFNRSNQLQSRDFSTAILGLPAKFAQELRKNGSQSVFQQITNQDKLVQRVQQEISKMDSKFFQARNAAKNASGFKDQHTNLRDKLTKQLGVEKYNRMKDSKDLNAQIKDAVKRKATKQADILQDQKEGMLDEYKHRIDNIKTSITKLNAAIRNHVVDLSDATNEMNRYGQESDHLENTILPRMRKMATIRLFAMGITEEAVRRMLEYLSTGYEELRKAGQTGTQAIGNLGNVIAANFHSIMQGTFVGASTVASALGAMSNKLGMTKVPESLTQDTAYMMKNFKLTSDEASGVSNAFYRMAGYSATTASHWVNIVTNIASRNMVNAGTVMKDIADNSELFYRHSSQGIAEFEKGAIAARQMNTSMQEMDSFADSMTGNFEQILTSQAKIQTIWPDFNFGEIMMASQFGSDKDVVNALKEQLHGRDVSSLPRSLQQLIQGSLGLSYQTIQSLSKGKQPGTTSDGYKTGDEVRSTGQALTTSIGDFVANSHLASWALGLLAASAVGASVSLAGNAMLRAAGISGTVGGFASGGIRSALGLGGSAAASGMSGPAFQLAGSAGGSAASAGIMGKVIGGSLAGGILSGVLEFFSSKNSGASMGKSAARAGIVGGSSILGGALAGAGLGTLGFPVIGTIIGGIGGAIMGGIGANMIAPIQHGGGMVGTSNIGRMVSSSVFANANRYHGGLLPNEFPTILKSGEAVLTRDQQSTVSNLTRMAEVNQGKNNMVDMSKIEDLLNKLINITKDGHVIEMDGQKVGAGILTSFSRA